MDPHSEFDLLTNSSFYGRSISQTQRSHAHRAIDAALQATHPQWKLGAVIVANGNILSVGSNKYRNDPSVVSYDGVSWHAEEVALKQCPTGSAQGAVMYVARVGRMGNICMSRPCSRCLPALREAGVSRVVYTHPGGVGVIPIYQKKR